MNICMEFVFCLNYLIYYLTVTRGPVFCCMKVFYGVLQCEDSIVDVICTVCVLFVLLICVIL